MSSRFKIRGAKQGKMFTKAELQETYEKRFKALSDALQQIQTIVFRNIVDLSTKLGNLEHQVEAIDYRTVTTRDLLIKKGTFTDDEHTTRARELRVETFKERSAADDIKRKLLPLSDTAAAELGNWITVQIDARYPETLEVPSIKVSLESADGKSDEVQEKETQPHPQAGQKIDGLSSLRSKIKLGAGNLMPELEKELVGLKVGDKKDIKLTMPKAYGAFAEKEVIFSVEVFDLKQEPPVEKKEAAVAEGAQANGQA